jgi:hypothetical protein
MIKPALASWKTTIAACLLALDAIGHAATAVFDTDPLTNPDWNMTYVAVIAAIGLLFARDSDKSSQDVGVRK